MASDYPGATGRFINGHNFVDFLGRMFETNPIPSKASHEKQTNLTIFAAAGLGVASPPAYLSIFNATGSSSSSMFLKGVNFASGGAGVLALTNMVSFSYFISLLAKI